MKNFIRSWRKATALQTMPAMVLGIATRFLFTVVALIALASIMLPVNVQAQNAPRAPSLPEPGLDQLVAPVALYPDALLAQLLMASTYPLDVAEAARWASLQPALTPEIIGRANAGQRWESSVKALLPFAPILTMMSNEKNWTGQLAAAVTKQPAALLETIQALRERAYDNGALHSSRQQQVQRQDRVVLIEPDDTRRVYVPYYDPAQVYSPAGNSLLPPEYWAAQPFAAPQYRPPGNGIAFSIGIDIPDRAFYDARIDWRSGRLMVRHTTITGNTVGTGPDEWRHDPQYRTRKQTKPSSDTVSTESASQSASQRAASINSRDAGMSPPVPGGEQISTRRPRAGAR